MKDFNEQEIYLLNQEIDKYKTALDEIEKVLDTGVCCDGEDIIRQLIKQAKKGKEE